MKLNFGDTIGIIAPSGAISDKDSFFKNIEALKADFRVKILPHVLDDFGFLASCDENRLEDLHNAFLDAEIKAILCARGGYGAIRLLDKINWEIIKNNKKPFIGFSDITAFHIMFYKMAGLKTYHAPMLMSGFATDKKKDCLDTINGFKKELCAKKILQSGDAEGILWGGNLATLISLFGADFIPDQDIILFLEDINEPLYKLDKMIVQIYRNNQLRLKIKAICLGEFSGLNKKEQGALNFWMKNWAQMFKVPFLCGLNISHGKNNEAVPFAQRAKICGTKICLLYD